MSLTRTIVVWSPDWPVVAAAPDSDSGDKPVALFDRGRVFACSASARAEGVRRGLRTRDAQSRCPGLVVLPYDPGLDARRFEPVVTAVEALTPGVQVIRPGTCAIRARGPGRYFGGEERAAQAIATRLRTLPDCRIASPRVGIADGPFAAEQAARATTQDAPVRIVAAGESAAFLRDLSVDLLGQPELSCLLHRLGLRTLGAFAALPGTDVLNRFGPIGAHAHRLAGGGDTRPVTARRPPPELTCWVDFDSPADRVDQVAFGARRAADTFVSGLATEGLVCTTVRIAVMTEDGPGLERCWLHPRWFDAADVVDRVRWQLQGNGTATDTLSGGLTSPVVRVGLIPDEVDPIGAHASGLWGGGPDESVHRALSRVQSMLGHGAVVSPVVGGGRGPADRQTLVAWGDRPDPRWRTDAPWTGKLPAPAPTTVFPVPQPALVLTADRQPVGIDGRGVLSGEPARFCPTGRPRSGGDLQPVEAWAGPWPVSERWWDDTSARRLARFQVVGADGSAWLLMVEDGQWWTEARYD